MKVFNLITCADVEGRTTKTLGIFTNRSDACAVFNTGLVYGFTKADSCILEVEVHEDLVSFVATQPHMSAGDVVRLVGADKALEVARQRALNKLTPEDRAALGL